MIDDVVLELDSFDLDPEKGHFTGTFTGKICRASLTAIKVDQSDCKDARVEVDTELSKLY